MRSQENKKRAEGMMAFFKTGEGQYGHGDIFLGCWTTPQMQEFAKIHSNLSLKDLQELIKSPYHEERALALEILEIQYKKNKDKKHIDFYLKNKHHINNWDLVDMSAYNIIGDFALLKGKKKMLLDLAKSSHHWDRRIAIVASLAFIRAKELDLTYTLAKKFLKDKEDLMHKATGWMLREAGKRDLAKLLSFIKTYGSKMPRTMLRYAIEKLPESQRKEILNSTKPNVK